MPDKILAMARDIAKNGLNPSTIPVVFATSDNKNIVKDGNRRVTSLKILMDPKLVEDRDLRRKFERIQFDRSRFRYIDCVVFYDEDEADHWVELNHQNDSSGIGHMKWSTIQKMRDSRNHGRSVPILEMFELVQKAEPSIDEDDFPISNLVRVVDSKGFKNRTGWKFKDGKFEVNMPKSDFVDVLKEISLDIYDNEREDFIDSRSTNSAKNIEDYLTKKQNKGLFDKTDNPSSFSVDGRTKTRKAGKAKKTTGGPTTLIPADIGWNIDNPRIMDILKDLQKFSVNSHANSVSVLFRAFIEMFTAWFGEKHGIEARHLDDRIRKVAEFLRKENRISDKCSKSIKMILVKNDQALNINEELNQYGHNYELNPSPEALVQTSNSIRCLLEAMANYESENGNER
ncbi:MAG: hypothetical protein LKJ94_05775 [Candidatus Methanomethylophilus sp.]|jgi:hypothetical protein|nr:hypothetical protein [Methanomethylophilus sp.]